MSDDRRGVFVPLWAMEDCAGNARDAMVLAQITWWLQPSQREAAPRTRRVVERQGHVWLYLTDEQLGDELSMSADQVYRARKSLRASGLLETCAGFVNGQRMTLTRPVRPDAEQDSGDEVNRGIADSKPRSRGDITAESRSSPSIDRGSNSLAESENPDSPYDGSKEPPTAAAVLKDRKLYPPQFLECWSLYPKHCDHDRIGAYKVWRARVAEAPKQGTTRVKRMENLLAAVQGYAIECEEEDREERFMKDARTFFGAHSVMAYCARLARERCGPPRLSVVS